MLLSAAVLAACGVGPAGAEEAMVVARGTAGLSPTPVHVVNDTGAALRCTAATAHWYSVDFGTVAAGAALDIPLWTLADKGEVYVLNARQDHMPVINLWCGLEGRAWVTRSPLPLLRTAGKAAPPRSLACRMEGGTLACR